MANVYVDSVGWTAVTAWAALTAYVSTANGGRGDYRRQLAGVAAGSERVFRCTVSGTSGAAEPTWTTTKNGVTAADGTVTWTECTGQEADQVSGTWKAPHARAENAAAATWGAVDDTFYLGDDHAQTQAGAVTVAFPGTAAQPNRVLSVNHLGTVPPVAADLLAGASFATTGANNLTVNGHFYAYGISLKAGDAANAAIWRLAQGARDNQIWDSCDFYMVTTASSTPTFGAGGSVATLINCRLKFAATGQTTVTSGKLVVYGGSIISGGSTPTLFISDNVSTNVDWEFNGFDFSNLAATFNITRGTSGGCPGKKVFRNCKLPAAWSGVVFGTAVTVIGSRVELYNTDATSTNYRLWVEDFTGSTKHETTIIRTSGASDGTTPFSWIMVSSANSDGISNPLRSPEIYLRNETTGSSKILTVEIIHSGVGAGTAGAFTDQEIWLEVDYLGTSGFPLSTRITDRAATVLTTAADQTSSSTTWTSSPSTPVKQSLGVTFTPQVKGMYIARICLATASKTVYVDPVITVS